jgi:hypothetical protein
MLYIISSMNFSLDAYIHIIYSSSMKYYIQKVRFYF